MRTRAAGRDQARVFPPVRDACVVRRRRRHAPPAGAEAAELELYRRRAWQRRLDARIWDKRRGRETKIGDLWTDWPEAVRRLTPGFCRALDAERLEKRGEPTPKDDMFGKCPSLAKEATIVPVATRGGQITRLNVTLDPYVAGPYSDGPYQLTLILAPRALALLKPNGAEARGRGWRTAALALRNGAWASRCITPRSCGWRRHSASRAAGRAARQRNPGLARVRQPGERRRDPGRRRARGRLRPVGGRPARWARRRRRCWVRA